METSITLMFEHPPECKLEKEALDELMDMFRKIAKKYICDDTSLTVFSSRQPSEGET